MAKKVVVFGSCNLDMFFEMSDMGFFVKTGLGAEDAIHFKSYQQAPGGKGANQAVAAARAGAKVELFGAVGEGAHGRYLIDILRKEKVGIKGVLQTKAPTGIAVIFNKPDGSHKVVVGRGANLVAKSKQVPDTILNKNTILVFQTETDLKENALLMKRGKKRGCQVVFNVAPAAKIAPDALRCVDYLILNRPEAELIAEGEGFDATDLGAFAQKMAERYNLTCIVTLGEKGILAVFPDEIDIIVAIPALPIKAIDTIGAGDAFVGAFSAALAENAEVKTALYHGVVAGSLACTRVGAQSALPSAAEIVKNVKKLMPKAVAKKK